MTYSHIIWDFNGTILDDVKTGIDAVNTMLQKRNIPIIPDIRAYHELFGFPVKDYYKRLGFDFEKESYDTLSVEWVDLYMKNVVSAPLNTGIKEALNKFASFGIPQIILSATEAGMLEKQLNMLCIREYFDSVFGLDNIHAGGKTHLCEVIKEKYRPTKALVIGDTTHDFETSLKLDADCILFSGGHMKKALLLQCGCPVIDNISDIFLYLK